MEALKFDLHGKVAHFKNPEYNLKVEISYDNIPKTVIIGILGSILGLRGRESARNLGYIEYWEVLKNTKIAIVPSKARWRKHIDELTNSTGFGNAGENQIVRRQMLENVKWTIYILRDSLDDDKWTTLTNMLINRKSSYPIFLGKTECKARVGNVEVVTLDDIEKDDVEYCDSILLNSNVEEIENEKCEEHSLSSDELFLRKDYYPVEINEKGLYSIDKFTFTNSYISVKGGTYYKDNNLILNII